MAVSIVSPRHEHLWVSQLRKYWLPALFLAPAAFFLAAFIAVPMIQAILLGFQRWNGIEPATWIGLRNYENLLQDKVFWQSMGNVVYYTLATTIFQTTIPLLIANILNSGSAGQHRLPLPVFLAGDHLPDDHRLAMAHDI